MPEGSDSTFRQVARYCDNCDQHVAARVVGLLVVCTECSFIVEDNRYGANNA